MNQLYLAKVLPSIFRNGASTTLEERTIPAYRANADLLRRIFQRAQRLNHARHQASATSIAAGDFASGALLVGEEGCTYLVMLRKVYFDCAIGRPPSITLEDSEGIHYRLLPGAMDVSGGLPESTLQPGLLECKCKCGFISFREALRHPKWGHCVDCGAPGAALLREVAATMPA